MTRMRIVLTIVGIAAVIVTPLFAGGQSESEPTAESDRPFEGYELNITMEAVPETDFIETLIPQFEEETGMTVNINVVNFNVMYETLVTQLSGPAGRGTDDLIQVTNAWSDQFPRADWMLPLDDYMDSSGFDSAPYVDAIWDGLNTVSGGTYFVPFYHWSLGWMYRTDLLSDGDLAAAYEAEYGRELQVPESVEELLDFQAFMTREIGGDQMYGTVLQGSSPQNIPEFLPYFFSHGAELFEDGEVVVDNARGVEAIQLYVDAFGNAPEGAQGMQFDQTQAVMAQGNAASMVGYLWMKGVIEGADGSVVSGKLGMTNMPGGTGFLGAWGWGIPKSSPNPDAAWAFINWVESYDIARERAALGGEPTRLDIYEDEELLAENPDWPTHLEILQNARTWPVGLRTEEGQDIIGTTLLRAVVGEITAERAAELIAEDLRSRVTNIPD